MRSGVVVSPPVALRQHTHLQQRIDDLSVQQSVLQLLVGIRPGSKTGSRFWRVFRVVILRAIQPPNSTFWPIFTPKFQPETPQETRRALGIVWGYLGYLVIGSIRPALAAATRIRTAVGADRCGACQLVKRRPKLMRSRWRSPLHLPRFGLFAPLALVVYTV